MADKKFILKMANGDVTLYFGNFRSKTEAETEAKVKLYFERDRHSRVLPLDGWTSEVHNTQTFFPPAESVRHTKYKHIDMCGY